MDVIDADGRIVEKETDMRTYLPGAALQTERLAFAFGRTRQLDGRPSGRVGGQ